MANMMNPIKSLVLLQALKCQIHVNMYHLGCKHLPSQRSLLIPLFQHGCLHHLTVCFSAGIRLQQRDCSPEPGPVAEGCSMSWGLPWCRREDCGSREGVGRKKLSLLRSHSGMCLLKVHLGCGRKGQEGRNRAACRVGKLIPYCSWLSCIPVKKWDGRAWKPAVSPSPFWGWAAGLAPGERTDKSPADSAIQKDIPGAEEERENNW